MGLRKKVNCLRAFYLYEEACEGGGMETKGMTDEQWEGWNRDRVDKAAMQGERREVGSDKESGCTKKQARSWALNFASKHLNQSGNNIG